MKDTFEQNDLKGVQAPKLCYTAGGMLIHEGKVLLVKHKKLGIWLNPGGHIDEGELPHEAAEREFFEETGVKVQAVDVFSLPGSKNGAKKNFSVVEAVKKIDVNAVGFMPNPMTTNVHWVNKESYKIRLESDNPDKRFPTKIWKRGCEQHVGFFYMLKPVEGVEFYQNEAETDGIAWFGPEEIDGLETTDNVKKEVKLGFALMKVEN